MIEALSLAGMDFAVVDMEHAYSSVAHIYPLKLAAEARNFDLIVRVPVNSEEYMKWCLDLGYKYIQVPFIHSVECAKKAVKFSYFFPQGERGLCRFVRAADFSTKDKNDYFQQNRSEVRIILQIEGKNGFDKLDEILNVEGIYAIFIGPYDLSQSLGFPGDIWNAQVVDCMKSILEKCKNKKIKVGTFAESLDGVDYWSKLGVDFIEYASDLNILINAYRSQFMLFKTINKQE